MTGALQARSARRRKQVIRTFLYSLILFAIPACIGLEGSEPGPAAPALEPSSESVTKLTGGPNNGSSPSSQSTSRTQEQIVAKVKRLGGSAIVNEDLPGKQIVAIDLHGTRVRDADLELLEGLTNLYTLNLYDTRITDEGLKNLKTLGKLHALLELHFRYECRSATPSTLDQLERTQLASHAGK
jgi:hypothetical protein